MPDTITQTPRIVLYGTGTYGNTFVRLAEKKGWPIVAAFNRAGDKVGQDLGRVAGLERDLGVIIQDCDTANYDNLDADVAVVVTTDILEQNWPAYERLLGAGLNVICHGGQACYPQASNAEVSEKIEQLARQKNVSFMGASVWDYSRIWAGILTLGPCIEVDSIRHSTLTDINYPRQDVAEQMGIGLSVDEFTEKMAGLNYPLGKMYVTVVEQVLRKAGLTVTGRSEKTLPALLDQPVYSRALERDIEAGKALGYNIEITLDTAEGVAVSGNFVLRILADGEVENFCWDVDGTPSNSLVVERKDSVTASAACMLNRIPDIIRAEPGIQLACDMAPITPNL